MALYSTTVQHAGLPRPIPALEGISRTREQPPEDRPPVALDRNERVGPMPQWFLEVIRASVQSVLLTAYPNPQPLYAQLARSLGLDEAQLLLTPGSDAAFRALFHAYVRPNDTVVMLDPSYAMYSMYAQMFGARACLVPFDRSLALDVDRLLESVGHSVRLVVVANPNQPTGTLLSEDQLRRLAERTLEAGVLLAVDEAYYPFSQTTILPWLARFPQVVVTRTFSKAAGLAGLRLGFAAGHPEVIANLYKVRSAHDINSMALHCAGRLLEHPELVEDYVAEVRAGAAVLTARARAIGLVPLPSHTNFVLIRVAHRLAPAHLVEALLRHGYRVKAPFTSPCLADCIRVTVGPPQMMEEFSQALAQVVTHETT